MRIFCVEQLKFTGRHPSGEHSCRIKLITKDNVKTLETVTVRAHRKYVLQIFVPVGFVPASKSNALTISNWRL